MLDKWIDYRVVLDDNATLRYKAKEWRYAHKVAKTRGVNLQKVEVTCSPFYEKVLKSWDYRNLLANEKDVSEDR